MLQQISYASDGQREDAPNLAGKDWPDKPGIFSAEWMWMRREIPRWLRLETPLPTVRTPR